MFVSNVVDVVIPVTVRLFCAGTSKPPTVGIADSNLTSSPVSILTSCPSTTSESNPPVPL